MRAPKRSVGHAPPESPAHRLPAAFFLVGRHVGWRMRTCLRKLSPVSRSRRECCSGHLSVSGVRERLKGRWGPTIFLAEEPKNRAPPSPLRGRARARSLDPIHHARPTTSSFKLRRRCSRRTSRFSAASRQSWRRCCVMPVTSTGKAKREFEEISDSGACCSRCIRSLLFPGVKKFDEPSLRRGLGRVLRQERAVEGWGGGMQDKDRAAVWTPTACLHIEKTAAHPRGACGGSAVTSRTDCKLSKVAVSARRSSRPEAGARSSAPCACFKGQGRWADRTVLCALLIRAPMAPRV